jgi:thiol-disulfide isomerase/thioredoxin
MRNPADAACDSALAKARAIAPLAHGEVAALQVASEARAMPQLTFTDATGASKSLADWHGRTVLLNLWATWCVPCRREMPALQALEEKLGGKNFEVVAVNIDTRDPQKPKA